MQIWRTFVFRALAIINAIFASLGSYFLVDALSRAHGRSPHSVSPRYYLEVFYAMSAVNFLFLLGLLVASVYLWGLRRRGWVLCNIVFGAEILYFLLSTCFDTISFALPGNLPSIGLAMGAAGGTGNMGIATQIITGYPLIALIVMNVTYLMKGLMKGGVDRVNSA
jgi:hypothetical protein